MRSILGNNCDPEKPVDRALFLQRIYHCFEAARIGQLPPVNDIFGEDDASGKNMEDESQEDDEQEMEIEE